MPIAFATMGAITDIAVMCILLAAGITVLPEKFRIHKCTLWMRWMRRVQQLWWVVLLLAFASYARCYVRNLFRK
jgi:hypothetical protein